VRNTAAAVVSVLVMLMLACVTRPQPYQGSPTRGQMISHFELALHARSFAILGRVGDFRRVAEALADLEPAHDLPAEVILQLGPMRWEAREGARASTIEEAATATARVAQTCGDCHTANDVPLADRFTVGGPPPAGSGERHMIGLAWTSRLLWDGLIAPSNRTWYAGAEALMELGALPRGLDGHLSPGRLEAASRLLGGLGEEALRTDDPDERVRIAARIWSTCAGCHAEVAPDGP